MVGILSRFLLGSPIFRGELLVLGSVSGFLVPTGSTFFFLNSEVVEHVGGSWQELESNDDGSTDVLAG